MMVHATAFEIFNHLTLFVLKVSQVVGITQSSKKTAFYLFFLAVEYILVSDTQKFIDFALEDGIRKAYEWFLHTTALDI